MLTTEELCNPPGKRHKNTVTSPRFARVPLRFQRVQFNGSGLVLLRVLFFNIQQDVSLFIKAFKAANLVILFPSLYKISTRCELVFGLLENDVKSTWAHKNLCWIVQHFNQEIRSQLRNVDTELGTIYLSSKSSLRCT